MFKTKKAELTNEYRSEWNISKNVDDFFNICNENGNPLSDTLYRKGGIGGQFKDGYIMLLKQVEAFYSDELMEMCGDRSPNSNKHLENQFVILNEDGIEKVNFDRYQSPYLVGGVVYVLDEKYYNIESGEFYCGSYTTMKSDEFIFLNDEYNRDKSKRGVLKINKLTGSIERFKLSN